MGIHRIVNWKYITKIDVKEYNYPYQQQYYIHLDFSSYIQK